MRPLGSWYFGRLADRRGRRGAMLASIAMMGAGSAAIAVLPTYAGIGVAAPALLLVARMVQGFSTGGQYGTAATYLSEIAPARRRGFFASFQYVTLIGGQLLAVLVLQALRLALPAGTMATIGWRIAFAGGALAAFAMLAFRGAIHESGDTTARREDAGRFAGLIPHRRAFLTVLGLTAGGSLTFYVWSTYMQKYLVNSAHLTPATADAIMTALLVPFMALQPLFGALSDRIGRRANLIAFAALASATTVPLLGWLAEARGAFAAFLLVLAGLAVNSLYTSVSGLFKAELFPLHVRALGVGLAYGIGNALFGGTAEAIALLLKRGGHEGWFAWYVTAICLVSLATALTIRRPRGDRAR
jgi:MHS family alpha-ketoglutarate permease-like MFS transporter